MKNLKSVGVVSLSLVVLAAALVLLVTSKPSAAQAGPGGPGPWCENLEPPQGVCNSIEGWAVNVLPGKAKSDSVSNCESNVNSCLAAKSAECAQYCMTQGCAATATPISAGCSASDCGSGSDYRERYIEWQRTIGVNIANINIDFGRVDGQVLGRSINFSFCKSVGSGAVNCQCRGNQPMSRTH